VACGSHVRDDVLYPPSDSGAGCLPVRIVEVTAEPQQLRALLP
jgi:hypothetical protein